MPAREIPAHVIPAREIPPRQLLRVALRPRRPRNFEIDAGGEVETPNAVSVGPSDDDEGGHYSVVKGLGQGGYGVVVEVVHDTSKRRFAMKVVAKKDTPHRINGKPFGLEQDIMNKMGPSPFTLNCHSMFETKFSACMVTDLLSGNDLFYHNSIRLRETGTGFSEDETRVLLAEVTLALEYMHTEGFIHRDVKMENVVLDAEGHVKLIDFGLACECNLTDEIVPMPSSGTLSHMAPELVQDNTGGRHTDWWAVGVLTFEMLTGSCPWSSQRNVFSIKREILSRNVISPPAASSPDARHFIASLLQKDFRRRLGSASDSEVKEAPFFSVVDWGRTAILESPSAFTPPACGYLDTKEQSEAMESYKSLLVEESES